MRWVYTLCHPRSSGPLCGGAVDGSEIRLGYQFNSGFLQPVFKNIPGGFLDFFLSTLSTYLEVIPLLTGLYMIL